MKLTPLQQQMVEEYGRGIRDPGSKLPSATEKITIGWALRQIAAKLHIEAMWGFSTRPKHHHAVAAISIMQDLDAIEQSLPQLSEDAAVQKRVAMLVAGIRNGLKNTASGASAEWARSMDCEVAHDDNPIYQDLSRRYECQINLLADEVDAYQIVNAIPTGRESDTRWITVTEAEQITGKSKGSISRASKPGGPIRTNGKEKGEKRLDADSAKAWATTPNSADPSPQSIEVGKAKIQAQRNR